MKQIFDEEGSQIKSINLSDEEEYFYKPFIIFDVLKDKEKEPELEQIEPPVDLGFLEDLKICFYAIPIKRGESWAPRQRYIYFLRPEDIPVDETARKVKKLPANHYLEIDRANRKIRLHGNCIDPNKSCTEWINY